ncbi:MAG TPA: hypothetical protein DDY78_07980 [Planctomycetales bacterium]|jgi:hypothetical protein|nr:hypothetical protein [Planctomycetales bacterium]
MPARESKPAGESFVELLRQQIEFLQGGVYEYESLDIYTAGSDEPWSFDTESELEIHEEQGLLVARDGPSEEQGNEDVPEYVIRLNAIVGSQLV